MILLPLLVGTLVGFSLAVAYPDIRTFEDKRSDIISDMEELINDEVASGSYRCCIDPPCTMCLLGQWIWDDGICRCDDLIVEGDFDNVCPQCKSKIKEGGCKSSLGDACSLIS